MGELFSTSRCLVFFNQLIFDDHCLGSLSGDNQMLITISAKMVNMSCYLSHDLLKNNGIFIFLLF